MVDKPTHFVNESSSCIDFNRNFNECQLKRLGTQMGYPIGVPIWVL